ncbi:MAG: 4-(cytidine 5'-diphospho)-2-C-methyl-D-erythritol kinase [Desulfobacteraceae bacterium]|nr:4-(cytidine 5'-diphospho)-2-C-methyl-D-erythritol kinase [Desulfobacteraceae bacterium]
MKTRVPAKINFWLEVIRKRADGYHDLSSLMLPISVFDDMELRIEPGERSIALSCDRADVPSDARNLAWKAADLFFQASGISAAVRIDLRKSIPSGAGLGGGSSDAGGILTTLNNHFGNPVEEGELKDLARRIGADVPFFLRCRPALATGIGEELEFASGVPSYPLLLLKPPINVATGWVYQNLKLTRTGPQIKLGNFNAHPWGFGDFLVNDLESVTVPAHPIISELKSWLLARGALASSMSGSGPTVFGIFPSGEAAREAEKLAVAVFPDCWVKAAEVIGDAQ